ncbi:hypothetical protein [Deminuibacter soli]|uniref:Glycosyl transferase n=1 Tax=Deminuibacter soli TaxID=2291815 RepID=A0A3E1NIR0_9BACT|nr:hypothetical protein [Deminuibacter soli]RFM27817.1 hypothetical protein DXN05_14070 [Deminuibacter soli]
MQLYCTVCSNNYLAQAGVLGASVKKHAPGSRYMIFLCDEPLPDIDYTPLADEVIPVAAIEPAIHALAARYNTVELNTCLKPRIIEYLFTERGEEKVIYLDPDTKLFSSPAFLYQLLDNTSILLTPHIYTPIPLDNKTPGESTFLNFGLYNLGFIGLSNTSETTEFIRWWKNHTYQQGYIDVYKGIFVDQLPINHVPIFFKNVHILHNTGVNMAPWNLHERYLSAAPAGAYMVNGNTSLVFYHFSSFRAGHMELPLQHYNRFNMAARPDLHELYRTYNDDLKAAGYARYSHLTPAYDRLRKGGAAARHAKSKWQLFSFRKRTAH